MANTVIALKKSSTPSAQPTTLANGELAINFSDGKLFYKHANGTILPFNTTGGNAFGTVNANGTLVVADSASDVLTIEAGSGITIVGDAINDKITINSSVDVGPAFDKANSANLLAYNTGIGANAFAAATIAGANTEVGSGANSYAAAIANTIAIAAFDRANTVNTIAVFAYDAANSALAAAVALAIALG